METDTRKLLLTDGRTAEEFLSTQPEEWRSVETSAIYECLRRGWPLHVGNIQYVAREIR